VTDHARKYVTRILKVSKKRAAKLQVPFDLDREWLWEHMASGECEATGISLVLDHRWGDHGYNRSPWGPSIDRIEPSAGYTKANSRIVCNLFNLMKGEGTDEDVLIVCRALLRGNENAQNTYLGR